MNSKFMTAALSLAAEAARAGEVPVGAVVVRNGIVVGKGRNMREEKQNALSHAEIEAINDACKNLGSWRLDDCEIYVTLEPCPMCAGAIINARLKTLVFGAYDLKMGCIDSVTALCDLPLGQNTEIYGGIMEDECSALLGDFFGNLR